MRLYGFWRSSATWRVRIALGLKRLPYEYTPVDLTRQEQLAEGYRAFNPMRQVPLLELDDGRRLAQSLAIIEYLDETVPAPPLLPRDPFTRAVVRQLAEIINAGIQPLQNTSTLAAIEKLGGTRESWGQQFINPGLDALAAVAQPHAGQFLVGDTITMADVCLVPQLYNARRFGCDVERWPLLVRVEEACMRQGPFQNAHAERQPDATVKK